MTHFGRLIGLKDGLVEMYPTPPVREAVATYSQRLPGPQHNFDGASTVGSSGEEGQRIKGSNCSGSDEEHIKSTYDKPSGAAASALDLPLAAARYA